MDKRIEDGQKNRKWAKEQRMGERLEDGQKNRKCANKKMHQVGSALPSRDRQSCGFLGWRLQKKITTGGTNKIVGLAY